MNKFLNLTFKIGKVFSSILLVIVLLVMLGCGIGLLTFGSGTLKTPSFSEVKQAFIETNDSTTMDTGNVNSTSQSIKVSHQYNEQIQKIIRKHHLKEEVKYLITKNIDKDIPEELISQYLKGLDRFYKDGLRYINSSDEFRSDFIFDAVYSIEGMYQYEYHLNEARNNVKVNGIYNYYVSAGLAMKYHDLFINSLQQSAIQQQASTMNKIALQIIFAVSILVFSILLFLPVLIKIEENTRPIEDRAEVAKDEDTKTCISCGKQIKTSAKKCRFCGAWQNKSEENNGGNE